MKRILLIILIFNSYLFSNLVISDYAKNNEELEVNKDIQTNLKQFSPVLYNSIDRILRTKFPKEKDLLKFYTKKNVQNIASSKLYGFVIGSVYTLNGFALVDSLLEQCGTEYKCINENINISPRDYLLRDKIVSNYIRYFEADKQTLGIDISLRINNIEDDSIKDLSHTIINVDDHFRIKNEARNANINEDYINDIARYFLNVETINIEEKNLSLKYSSDQYTLIYDNRKDLKFEVYFVVDPVTKVVTIKGHTAHKIKKFLINMHIYCIYAI